MIKQLTKRVLDKLGYVIQKKETSTLHHDFDPMHLRLICQPKTVIDVGVAYGTHTLYEAYPDAHFILVEPLQEYESALADIAKKFSSTTYFLAVGSAEGTLEISVDKTNLEKSGFLERTSLTKSEVQAEKRMINITTLDKLFERHSPADTPILLKIDTEGHELAALQGATSLLKVVDTVIAEVSIAKRFEGSYEFEEIMSFMRDHDFYLFSFLSIVRPTGEARPRFVDVVFKRRAE